jgi:hypothetical protein
MLKKILMVNLVVSLVLNNNLQKIVVNCQFVLGRCKLFQRVATRNICRSATSLCYVLQKSIFLIKQNPTKRSFRLLIVGSII